MMSNISLYASRPNLGKYKFITDYINNNQDKSILLLGLQADSTWYLKHIISNTLNIDSKRIEKYLYPCSIYTKDITDSIDKDVFIDTLEKLHNSKLIIKDYPNYILEKNNLLDVVIEDIKSIKPNIIMIDRLEELVNYSNKNLDEILSTLKELSNNEIIIFNFLNREFEETYKIDSKYIDNLKTLSKYINNIYIIYDKEGNIKEI